MAVICGDVVIDDIRDGINYKLELWRESSEYKFSKLSRTKSEYMSVSF